MDFQQKLIPVIDFSPGIGTEASLSFSITRIEGPAIATPNPSSTYIKIDSTESTHKIRFGFIFSSSNISFALLLTLSSGSSVDRKIKVSSLKSSMLRFGFDFVSQSDGRAVCGGLWEIQL